MRICCCSSNPLVLRHLRGADGRHDIRNLLHVLTVVPTPKPLADAYAQMLRLAQLHRPPQLVFAQSAFNMGGFFTPGLIVVGVDDSDAIARSMWSSNGPAINRLIRSYLHQNGAGVTSTFEVLAYVVRGRIIAHELGHALINAGFRTPYWDEEAGADYIAGLLDGHRGRNLALGEMMFWSIGCEGERCDHPPPVERANAYRAGYSAAPVQAQASL